MKKILLLLVLKISVLNIYAGQTSETTQEMADLKVKQTTLEASVQSLEKKLGESADFISVLQNENKTLQTKLDSLTSKYAELVSRQDDDRNVFNGKIKETNDSVSENKDLLEQRTLWGTVSIVILVVVISLLIWWFVRRFKNSTDSIDDVRKAQNALEEAQKKMQEESIKLDNQLLAVASRQIATATQKPIGNDAEPDHSLAKKVADEIVRIELNLSRMDSSIKGHKQLAKAVQRIKDNFNANGYEIVDMLGKPYNEGMKVVANFVADENLPEGSQIITGITKPQINYNGQMIQSAQITVSQNI